MVSGELIADGKKLTITGGKILGNEITFTAGQFTYRGKIKGNSIEGTAENGKGTSTRWSAVR